MALIRTNGARSGATKTILALGTDGTYLYLMDCTNGKSYRSNTGSAIFDDFTVTIASATSISINKACKYWSAPSTPLSNVNDMTATDYNANASITVDAQHAYIEIV